MSITIIKSLTLSKFVHLFISLPAPPNELIKRLENIFFLNFYGIRGLIGLKGELSLRILLAGVSEW